MEAFINNGLPFIGMETMKIDHRLATKKGRILHYQSYLTSGTDGHLQKMRWIVQSACHPHQSSFSKIVTTWIGYFLSWNIPRSSSTRPSATFSALHTQVSPHQMAHRTARLAGDFATLEEQSTKIYNFYQQKHHWWSKSYGIEAPSP